MPNIEEKKENFHNKSKPKFSRRGNKNKPQEGTFVPKPGNDASWYKLNADVADVIGRLPFAKPLGINLVTEHADALNSAATYSTASVPGIMSIDLESRVPIADGNYNQMLAVMQNVYSWVRHANSGHANYDPVDLMYYLLSVGELYAYLGFMWGVYSTVCLAATENRYYGRRLIEAKRLAYDSFIAHRNDFFAYINLFADRLQTLAVPAKMPFFMKKLSQYMSIYSDREGWKGQIYQFVPRRFLYFDHDSSTQVGVLKACEAFDQDDFSTVVERGELMLNKLLLDEDAGIISGDIIKATRDKGGIFMLPRLVEGTSAQPVVNVDILSQIHNLTVTRELQRDNTIAYTQIDGSIYHVNTPVVNGNAEVIEAFVCSDACWGEYTLDAFEDNPSSDRVLEMTRLISVNHEKYSKVGDSLQVTCNPWLGDVFAAIAIRILRQTSTGYGYEVVLDYHATSEMVMEYAITFDYGPILTQVNGFTWPTGASQPSFTVHEQVKCNDIVNPTRIDVAYLTDLNAVVVNSLFAVPALKHLQ